MVKIQFFEMDVFHKDRLKAGLRTRGEMVFRLGWMVVLIAMLPVLGWGQGAETFWRDAAGSSPMELRGETTNLPLYGGIPLYSDMFRGGEPNDHSTNNTFHNKAFWTERLDRMKALRENALVMIHPHPFTLFVDYGTKYPEAAWLKPEELAAKREMLRWLIAAAGERGIKLYWLTWNIWLPRGFAEKHGIKQEAEDSPLTREYTKWTVAEFFREYPGFGGMLTMAAETPPGCAEFVAEAIVGGMKQVEPRPRLIFWNWCTYPDQARKVTAAYDGPKMILSYLQYETFFSRKADPRIGLFSKDLNNLPMVALGGPKSQHSYMFFGHPAFVREVVNDLYKNNNGRGLLVECVEDTDRWLAREAFARYLWNPEEPYNEEFWRGRIAERYGSPALGAPLLAAMEAASEVIPTQLKLTHSQSDHFMAQFGITLAQALEMPTMSTYIFENETKIRPDGFLASNMGLDKPNPDWGEKVLPVRQWVIGQVPDAQRRASLEQAWITERRGLGYKAEPAKGDEQTPERIVKDLEGFVRQGRAAKATADALTSSVQTRREELARIGNLMTMNLNLGAFFAAKDQAAIDWEKFRLLGDAGAARECVAKLEESVAHWRELAVAADKVYPEPLSFWQSQLAAPLPWGQMDLWTSYGLQNQRYRDLTPMWEQELAIVRERLAQAVAVPAGSDPALREKLGPPTMDELRRPAPGGELVARIDFEQKDDPRYKLKADAKTKVALTEDPKIVIEGKRSLQADTRGSEATWTEYFQTVPGQVRLAPNTKYQVMLRYRVIDGGGLDNRPPFAMVLRPASGDYTNDVGDSRIFGSQAGMLCQRVMFATTKDLPDYTLNLSVHGAAALAVDEIRLEKVQ